MPVLPPAAMVLLKVRNQRKMVRKQTTFKKINTY